MKKKRADKPLLLGRIARSLVDRDWFTVGIELVILVIGVFLGIQVANWNEDANDAVREQKAMSGILEDLIRDRAILKSATDMAQVNIDASNYLLDQSGLPTVQELTLPIANLLAFEDRKVVVAPTGALPESGSLDIWKRITVHYYAVQADTAVRTLIAAGDLDLISDTSLVYELQRYDSLWFGVENSNDTTFRPFRDQAVFVGQRLGLSPFAEIPESRLVEAMQGDPELQGAVRTLLEFTILQQRQILTIAAQTERLIELVEAAIE